MEIRNGERMLAALLREVCQERGVEISSFSGDWIFRLCVGATTSHVFGYNFGLNSATAQMLGNDKAATAELLTNGGVEAVEHRLYHSPDMTAYVPFEGNWSSMLDYFHAHRGDIVCKPNEGTGGRSVFRVTSVAQLERAVHRVFARTRSLCLSPFLDITGEYRAYVLRGAVRIAYAKSRAGVIGDGRSTVRQLVLADPTLASEFFSESNASPEGRPSNFDLTHIPAVGEVVLLNWRHNLGQGGRPLLLDEADPRFPLLSELSRSATRILGIELAAVDIVEVDASFRVLEVNCGIMMETFARSSDENRVRARRFYGEIVAAVLGLDGGGDT